MSQLCCGCSSTSNPSMKMKFNPLGYWFPNPCDCACHVVVATQATTAQPAPTTQPAVTYPACTCASPGATCIYPKGCQCVCHLPGYAAPNWCRHCVGAPGWMTCNRTTCACGCHGGGTLQPPAANPAPASAAGPVKSSASAPLVAVDDAKKRRYALRLADELKFYDGTRCAWVVKRSDLELAAADIRCLTQAGWMPARDADLLVEPNRGF